MFLIIIALTQSLFAAPLESAEKVVNKLRPLISQGLHVGQTLSGERCQMHVGYHKLLDSNGMTAPTAVFSVEKCSDHDPIFLAISVTADRTLIAPTSELVSADYSKLDSVTQKFRIKILSGGNSEKYLSLEVSPSGVSVLARHGYIFDELAPRVLCLNMKKPN